MCLSVLALLCWRLGLKSYKEQSSPLFDELIKGIVFVVFGFVVCLFHFKELTTVSLV